MLRGVIVIIWLVVAVVTIAQDDGTIPFNLETEPAIEHGEGGRFTDPGAVFAYDGQFHMFRNRFAEFPGAVEVYYHTSEDGINWEQVGDDPVIAPDDVPYDVIGAYASSVHVEDDGTWVMYLYTYPEDETGLGEGGNIVRATANDPLGEWAFGDEPVLFPGESNTWDSFRVTAPSVVKQDNGYLMLYEGISEDFTDRVIGLATSVDGIIWEKHGEPVLTPELDWENDHTHQPRVVDTGESLIMLYRTYRGRQTSITFGLAISQDGTSWERLTIDEPLIEQSRPTNFQPMWYSALAYLDGTFAAPLEIRASEGGTHIFSAIFTIHAD